METICLGPQGSFSEDALLEICARFQFESCNQLMVGDNKDVLPTLCLSQAALAVSAMHTMTGGRVEVPFAGLVDLLDLGQQIRVPMALKMPINFSLLARHGVLREKLKGIVAHEKALGPCSKIIGTFPQFKAVGSNSEAAQMVATQGGYTEWAALASPKCGEIYGLSVLAQHVSDKQAVTTFYAFSKNVDLLQPRSNEWRLLAVFDLLHEPKSLVKVLSQIDQNILHLHSIHRSGGNYRFLIEVEMQNADQSLRCAEAIRTHTQKALVFTFPVVSM